VGKGKKRSTKDRKVVVNPASLKINKNTYLLFSKYPLTLGSISSSLMFLFISISLSSDSSCPTPIPEGNKKNRNQAF
jgi:hypothetical protein